MELDQRFGLKNFIEPYEGPESCIICKKYRARHKCRNKDIWYVRTAK